MTYLLDANVFIQAKNMHYGFDLCPGFWEWLDQSHVAGRVFSIDKVANELGNGKDELVTWAKNRKSFFLKSDDSVMKKFQVISTWIMSEKYEPAARDMFFSVADYFLTAHGLARDFTIVTHEKAANSAKKIKIPDVCRGLDIRVISPFDMLRQERAKFVLGS